MLRNVTSRPHFIWQAVHKGHIDVVPSSAKRNQDQKLVAPSADSSWSVARIRRVKQAFFKEPIKSPHLFHLR